MGFNNMYTLALATIILSLAMSLVLAQVEYSQPQDYTDVEDDDQNYDESAEEVVYNNLRPGSGRQWRFLKAKAADVEPKSGAMCYKKSKKVENICDGILINNGTTLLECCGSHCRSILDDSNNCGKCNRKCAFGRLCCTGRCINVSSNKNNCGSCDNKCKKGRPCQHGICGYA